MNKCIYKLSPIVKDAIWGGKNIFEIEGNCSQTVAELWEYVNLPQESNTIIGFDDQVVLSEVIEKSELPIVVKIINAKHDLSLQVHPDKSEVLLVLDAASDARVATWGGLDDLDLLKNYINSNSVVESLNYYYVKKGDILYLPAGVVHAIGGGILALEVQNPKLTTYRMFDYNRKINGKVRELHIDEALKSIKTESQAALMNCNVFNRKGLSKVFSCEYYDVYVLNMCKESISFSNPRFPASVVCVAGEGKINNKKVGFPDSFVCLSSASRTFVNCENSFSLVFSTAHSNDNEIILVD